MDELSLFSTDYTRVDHSRAIRLPGCIIVEPIHPHRTLASMTTSGRNDLIRCLAKAEELVRAHTDAEQIDVLSSDGLGQRVQFHVVPRTRRVLDVFQKARSEGAPASGAAIVDWLWSRHGDLGYSAADVDGWLATVRAQMRVDDALPETWRTMATCAARYCDWIDALPPRAGDAEKQVKVTYECLEDLRERLLALLAAGAAIGAVSLRGVEDEDDELPDGVSRDSRYDITHEEWALVFRRMAALPIGYYLTIDPDVAGILEAKPCVGDLGDDLADVWRDMRGGLLAWAAGHCTEAAWEWRFNLRHHWGVHALDALRQVQSWLSENESSDPMRFD